MPAEPVRLHLSRKKGFDLQAHSSARWVAEEASSAWKGRAQIELAGKNLACWCKPGEPCHADVLLELANRPDPAEGRGSDRSRATVRRPVRSEGAAGAGSARTEE